MDSISIRYGETFTLSLDTGDVTAETAAIFVGKPGQAYVLTQEITLTDGVGNFVLSDEDTQIPLGTYYYQINVVDADGYVEKYPSPSQKSQNCDDCDSGFPEFIVCEALDALEVS